MSAFARFLLLFSFSLPPPRSVDVAWPRRGSSRDGTVVQSRFLFSLFTPFHLNYNGGLGGLSEQQKKKNKKNKKNKKKKKKPLRSGETEGKGVVVYHYRMDRPDSCSRLLVLTPQPTPPPVSVVPTDKPVDTKESAPVVGDVLDKEDEGKEEKHESSFDAIWQCVQAMRQPQYRDAECDVFQAWEAVLRAGGCSAERSLAINRPGARHPHLLVDLLLANTDERRLEMAMLMLPTVGDEQSLPSSERIPAQFWVMRACLGECVRQLRDQERLEADLQGWTRALQKTSCSSSSPSTSSSTSTLSSTSSSSSSTFTTLPPHLPDPEPTAADALRSCPEPEIESMTRLYDAMLVWRDLTAFTPPAETVLELLSISQGLPRREFRARMATDTLRAAAACGDLGEFERLDLVQSHPDEFFQEVHDAFRTCIRTLICGSHKQIRPLSARACYYIARVLRVTLGSEAALEYFRRAEEYGANALFAQASMYLTGELPIDIQAATALVTRASVLESGNPFVNEWVRTLSAPRSTTSPSVSYANYTEFSGRLLEAHVRIGRSPMTTLLERNQGRRDLEEGLFDFELIGIFLSSLSFSYKLPRVCVAFSLSLFPALSLSLQPVRLRGISLFATCKVAWHLSLSLSLQPVRLRGIHLSLQPVRLCGIPLFLIQSSSVCMCV